MPKARLEPVWRTEDVEQLTEHLKHSDEPAGVTSEVMRTLAEAINPSPREAVKEREMAAQAPGHLAEAQVSVVGRCAFCGKPVTGREIPRDRQGRPRHHRCP